MKIFIDCGCSDGRSILKYKEVFSDYDFYGFDILDIYNKEWKKLSEKHNIKFIKKAVWISDGIIKYSRTERIDGATIMGNKWNYDKNNEKEIESIDFSKWLEQFKDDEVVIKFDIEGAEEDVLEKIISDGNYQMIKRIYIEWHYRKIGSRSNERFLELKRKLRELGIIVLSVEERIKYPKTLIINDCNGWSMQRLTEPLAKFYNFDMAFHNLHKTKTTSIEIKNPIGVTSELFRKYEQIHLNTIAADNIILQRKDFIDALDGKKIIMSIHSERDKDLQILKGDHWKRIDKFVSFTEYQRDKIKEYTGKDSRLIHHAVDEQQYKFIPNYQQTNNLGYIGRIMPHKRFKEITNVAKILNKKVVFCGFVAKGDFGDYINDCDRSVVNLENFVTEQRKMEMMKTMELYMAISYDHIEVGPLPIIECACMGIPVLATKMGWARDLFTHDENIYFVSQEEASNPVKLAEIVKNLLSDKNKIEKIRTNARKFIEDSRRLQDYVLEYRNVYKG